MATALSWPSLPDAIGGRSMPACLPVAVSKMRAVLSSETVTKNLPALSAAR
jgi:hypothetical protein